MDHIPQRKKSGLEVELQPQDISTDRGDAGFPAVNCHVIAAATNQKN
jgi:hypothetical protein